MTIKRAWHRLRYLHGKQTVNPLLYIFVYFSFITGLAFTYLTLAGTEHGLTMYQVMLDSAGYGGTLMWGVLMTLAAIGIVASLILRTRIIAESTAFLGFGLWFCLGWVYGLDGYLDGILITVVPNIAFWVWFSLRIEWYRRVVVPVRKQQRSVDMYNDGC